MSAFAGRSYSKATIHPRRRPDWRRQSDGRFFRSDLDKTGLPRINRSIEQRPGLHGGQTFEG
ncbi:hypothetical protein ASE23_04765 [Rhizobium sp. Root73]|nr:hypothetical protein ASC96_01410 [Rhizobium sp. Root1204]KQY17926.1 hypothetical protein ASD36_04765 [Rhizobium sp. Root1334]KRC13785.1 hypothetical protein ASE23_04765 [Rhizobium sp. Root73]